MSDICLTDRLLVAVLATLTAFGLLLGPGLVKAEKRGSHGIPDADSLTAAAVAFTLRYNASPPEDSTRDRWLARDKAKHVVFSALWTLSTQYLLVNKAHWTKTDALPASIASGAAIGITKEVYDSSRALGTVSVRDLVADAVGIGLAVIVIVT